MLEVEISVPNADYRRRSRTRTNLREYQVHAVRESRDERAAIERVGVLIRFREPEMVGERHDYSIISQRSAAPRLIDAASASGGVPH
jgi:hypothetical protein